MSDNRIPIDSAAAMEHAMVEIRYLEALLVEIENRLARGARHNASAGSVKTPVDELIAEYRNSTPGMDAVARAFDAGAVALRETQTLH